VLFGDSAAFGDTFGRPPVLVARFEVHAAIDGGRVETQHLVQVAQRFDQLTPGQIVERVEIVDRRPDHGLARARCQDIVVQRRFQRLEQ